MLDGPVSLVTYGWLDGGSGGKQAENKQHCIISDSTARVEDLECGIEIVPHCVVTRVIFITLVELIHAQLKEKVAKRAKEGILGAGCEPLISPCNLDKKMHWAGLCSGGVAKVYKLSRT